MPRKTDSNNPADWLHVAASDLEALQALANQELELLLAVKARLPSSAN